MANGKFSRLNNVNNINNLLSEYYNDLKEDKIKILQLNLLNNLQIVEVFKKDFINELMKFLKKWNVDSNKSTLIEICYYLKINFDIILNLKVENKNTFTELELNKDFEGE